MKKYMKLIFPILCAVLVLLSAMTAHLITQIRSYSTLINYVGIVRGASQRVVKLETNGQPDEGLIAYVDGIMSELLTGKGEYGLVRAGSDEYLENLYKLSEQWTRVKDEIQLVRGGAGEDSLLENSEEMFRIANDTVFSIENYSDVKAGRASFMIFICTICCGIACATVIVRYIRIFFRLKGEKEELERQAGRDELTGAYTPERFYSQMRRIVEENPVDKFAVLYIDFENFKYVNDVFGYSHGDELLKLYARLMMEDLREKELFCRNTADRFFALRRYESKEGLLSGQQLVDEKFSNMARAISDNHIITVVCGICCMEDAEERDGERLMNRANFAQKTVKNRPDIHYAFYDEGIRLKMIEENMLKDRMQEALDKKEFLVYMQPKVGVQDGLVKNAEALVRWNMPDRGMMPPGEFIPVLEKYHFIANVDQYVFEETCRWMQERIRLGAPVVPVSVNVSKIQFYNPEFVQVYSRIKERYQIPDRMLEIEFTETVAFEHGDFMLRIVKDLHNHGFLCSLDDFGTGYSSLGMLKDLPIDVLKLDGMFFKVSVNVSREKTIIRRVIQMIRELDICTVAEGVEQEGQVEFLKEVGCDLIQGYYFYKPMCIKDFESVLDAQG